MAKTMQDDAHVVNQIKSGTYIEGIVKASGDIRIDGTLKGTLQTEGKLVIGTSGQIDGEITCQNAEIHGVINGKITVNELLFLKASCKLLGDIVVGRLSIEPGAQFSGSCVMGNAVKGLYNGQGTTQERRTEIRQPANRQSLNAFARYSGMAFQIAATIVICLFIGKWLDAKFPMKFPVFTTALTILGVFLGVYFVIRDLLKQK